MLLSIFVGLGVFTSIFVQREVTDQDVIRDLSHTPITIKNESQSLDPDTLVKVTDTLPRKPATNQTQDTGSDTGAVEQNSITVNETKVYRF